MADSHHLTPLPSPPSHTTFPIIAVAIIGILATAFLLLSYYIFVIKCCLNWHRIDLLRRFSFSHRRRRRIHHPFPTVSPSAAAEHRGLDDAAIRSIPILIFQNNKFKNTQQNNECAVCLNEFYNDEKLRILPNCAHIFHIDCIDVWLQNNANCPLCRTAISPENFATFPLQDPNPQIHVIEIGQDGRQGNLDRPFQDRLVITKKGSMGDEWIQTDRNKDEQFVVQPIRRSFSMDSAGDSQLCLAVQEILKKRREGNNSFDEGSSRGKKSFFSFGQGKGTSKSAV